MRIQLSEHFTYKKLLRYVFPAIVMMVFSSTYSVIDGLFVSNFVGKTAFAAINLIMPLLMGMSTVGAMIGAGGSALISKTLGEGKNERANRLFTMLICLTVVIGFVLTVIGLIFIEQIAAALGATGQLLSDSVLYARIMLVFQISMMLQMVFQSLFATAEKPELGLGITVAAGVANILLDALFIVVFRWGLVGAVVATVISQLIGGGVPLFYFARKNNSLLRFAKPVFFKKDIGQVFINGSSEMMTNISVSIVSVLYNFQLMKALGENGIAAYGVIMYVYYIFVAIFMGYSIGCAPIIGYHYGAENHAELKNLLKKGVVLMGIFGVGLTVIAEAVAVPLSRVFVGYDAELLQITIYGFRLFSLSFLITGFNMFASAFFTALNNGFVSAAISFARTLLFQSLAVLMLPVFLGIEGIWLAVTVAEILTLGLSIVFFIKNRKRYHYA